HSHLDWIVPLPDGAELVAPNVRQGITTSVACNCGSSPAPLGELANRAAIERLPLAGAVLDRLAVHWRTFGEFLVELDRRGTPLTRACFAGHSTLRATVLGEATQPAEPSELRAMGALLEDALRDGAVGLSAGLEYFPGRYAGPSELEELARVAAA